MLHGLLTLIIAFVAVLPLRGYAQETVTPEQVLDTVTRVGHWLGAQSQRDANRISWPDDVLHPDTTSVDLAAGVPGKVLFFVALYKATGDEQWLELAQGGAAFLAAALQDAATFAGNQRRASLYSGIGGMAVALVNVQAIDPSPNTERAIERIVDLLGEWQISAGDAGHWSDEFNDLLYGEAGTVLALSFIADRTGSDRALALADSGGQFLLGEAQQAERGQYWLFRRGRDFNLPNFSHGTAGIGYTLATLARLGNEQAFADAAAGALDYLQMIALPAGGNVAIPYGWGLESWDGLFEFGWAHGVAGTALFLNRMAQQSGYDTSEFSGQLRDTLIQINLPGEPAEPFAEPSTSLDMRFGRAGVLAVLSELGRSDASVVPTRDAVYRYLIDAASGEDHVYWETDVPEFMGGGRAQFTGYLHGAAGIGIAMLKMHAAMTDVSPYVMLPDDPYSWQPAAR